MTEAPTVADTPAVKLTPKQQHVLRALGKTNRTEADVARECEFATHYPEVTARYYCLALQKAGLAEEAWALTPAGRALLDALKEEGEDR